MEGDYNKEKAEQTFGTAYILDVRKKVEERLGHSDFSVVPISIGFRIVIFKRKES